MKQWIGLGLIALGILGGLYVGIWVMFIGGICQVIEQIRAEDMVALKVAIGVARVMFAGPVTAVTIAIVSGIGSIMLKD